MGVFRVAAEGAEPMKFPPTRGSVSLDDAIKHHIISTLADQHITHRVDSVTAVVEPAA